MTAGGFPWLSALIGLPLVGALVTGFIRDGKVGKWVALAVALTELAASLAVLAIFDTGQNDQFQFVEKRDWIPDINAFYAVGIDGFSVLFLPLTSLLTVMALLASWNSVRHLQSFHYALLLALQGMTVGVFSALDMLLFFFFWELTLPPIFFLTGLWGIGPKRREAAVKYTLYMLFGGTALLLAIVILAMNTVLPENPEGAKLVFSLPELLANPLADQWQTLVFLLLLLAFGVKTPLLPFHTWMPTAAMEGPPHLLAQLTGLKLGVYGMIRFAMTLAPSAAVEYSWILGVLGAITLIYGALVALHQTNLRRLLAYASISHVGLVVVGIASLNLQGVQGAMLQLVNFTLIASSLMLIAGCIQHRLGSTELVHLGGLAGKVPRLTAAYFLFALASIGIPGLSGFPAEFLLVVSALSTHPSLGIAALAAAVISAMYTLDFTRKAFWGPATRQAVERLQDLRPREVLVLSVPAVLVLVLGLFPNLILQTNEKAADAWLSRILEQPVKSDAVAEEISE
jgi:NADH-quinone oxidoreductase subunit M